MKDIEIIGPRDDVKGYTLGDGPLQNDRDISHLEVWRRTVIVNHTRGLLYFSAASMLIDEQVGAMAAEKDGEHVVKWHDHCYVPAGWIIKRCRNEQRDRARELFRKIYRDFFKDAVECPEYISPLCLRSAGAAR